MTRAEFVKKYGGIYEHSPWVAEAVHGTQISIDALHPAMQKVVDAADEGRKIALLRAHPDLACAPADMTKLTASSQSEQAGAGLKECTPEEFAEFQKLNTDYKKKFGFPFIIAVTGLTRRDILEAFRKRINNSKPAEFETALAQVHKIALIRLKKIA